jgi:hypothetical protein
MSRTETAEDTGGATLPSEDAPVLGRAKWLGVPISEGERWVEDDVHVIRSTEVDVIAGDADFQQAVEQFIRKVEDLFHYLSTVEELSDNENETYLRLAPRFLKVYKELERREEERRRRLISISFGRLRERGEHYRYWQQSTSTPKHSSVGSPV